MKYNYLFKKYTNEISAFSTKLIKNKTYLLFLLIGIVNPIAFAKGDSAVKLQTSLIKVMRAYDIPVVGYAIIDHDKIITAKTLSIDPKIKVNPNSLFQAASISKSLSAYAALKLISQGKFNLNDSANRLLTSWKIPKDHYNRNDPVTIKNILNMTSGLSVSGFPGYQQGLPLPSLLEILNGTPPANTPAIRVFYPPGSRYFYSGGSYQVLQQIVEDVTHQSFNTFMNHSILAPLKMTHSIFQYPLNNKLRRLAIPAFLANGKMVQGGWNNYAIAASGGLWSTPTDLAKFALNIVAAYKGKNNAIVSQSLANAMLTRGENTSFGLGVVINGKAKTLNFRKNGHNLGYYSQLIMFPNTGQGAVIMTNSENGMIAINYLLSLLSHQYHWPSYFPVSYELVTIPNFSGKSEVASS